MGDVKRAEKRVGEAKTVGDKKWVGMKNGIEAEIGLCKGRPEGRKQGRAILAASARMLAPQNHCTNRLKMGIVTVIYKIYHAPKRLMHVHALAT
jgi:hypothetical protein